MPLPPITIPEHILKEIGQDNETPDWKDRGPHMSYSALSTYLACPKKYDFQYVKKAPRKQKVSLALGSGGHNALEKAMKRKIVSQRDSPVEEVAQWASDFMDLELRELPPSEIEKDVEPGSTKDKYISATKIFQKRDAPSISPLGAEVEFNIDLSQYQEHPEDEPIRIVTGKIDLIYDDMGNLITKEHGYVRASVEDYKFVSKKKSQAEVDTTPQLTLYAAAVKTLTGNWPTRLGLRLLHQGTKQDGPDAILLERDKSLITPAKMERRLRRLVYQFEHAERGIRNDVFPPTDNFITCSWCDFRDRCQDTLVDDFEAAKVREQTTPAL